MAAERPPRKRPASKKSASKNLVGKDSPSKRPASRRPAARTTSRDSKAAEIGGWVAKGVDLTPAELHAEHVRQRLAGGRPATPDAYADAREQWSRLPGAVSASPADLGEVPPAPPRDDNPSGDPRDERPEQAK